MRPTPPPRTGTPSPAPPATARPSPKTPPSPSPSPPRPTPFTIKGAIECELMEIAAKSPSATAVTQDMDSFPRGKWSSESQLWFQGSKPATSLSSASRWTPPALARSTLYATKSWDYGIVRFSINGKKAGEDMDLCSGQDKSAPTGPIELGTFEPQGGKLTLPPRSSETIQSSRTPSFSSALTASCSSQAHDPVDPAISGSPGRVLTCLPALPRSIKDS